MARRTDVIGSSWSPSSADAESDVSAAAGAAGTDAAAGARPTGAADGTGYCDESATAGAADGAGPVPPLDVVEDVLLGDPAADAAPLDQGEVDVLLAGEHPHRGGHVLVGGSVGVVGGGGRHRRDRGSGRDRLGGRGSCGRDGGSGGCRRYCDRGRRGLPNGRHRFKGSRPDGGCRLLRHGCRRGGCRNFGGGPSTLLDGADRLSDADHRSLGGDDLAEGAVGGGGDLGVDLVARHLGDRLVAGHRLAGLLEPAGDGPLGDRLTELGHADRQCHRLSSLAS